MKFDELNEEDGLNSKRIENCFEKIEKVLMDDNLTIAELLLVYGNLGYKLGANIRQSVYDKDFNSEPPNLEKLNQLYYENATPDVALMITGLTVAAWLVKLQE